MGEKLDVGIIVFIIICIFLFFAFIVVPNNTYTGATNVQILNATNSIEYQNAIEITEMREGHNNKYMINDEIMYIDNIYIIGNNHVQKFLRSEHETTECDESVIIGNVDCITTTSYRTTVFVHEDVSKKISI